MHRLDLERRLERGTVDECLHIAGRMRIDSDFNHADIFQDHDDELDPSAQPWELLEPPPKRNTSPKHYIHANSHSSHHIAPYSSRSTNTSPTTRSQYLGFSAGADSTTLHHSQSLPNSLSLSASLHQRQFQDEHSAQPLPPALTLIPPQDFRLAPFPQCDQQSISSSVRMNPFPIESFHHQYQQDDHFHRNCSHNTDDNSIRNHDCGGGGGDGGGGLDQNTLGSHVV